MKKVNLTLILTFYITLSIAQGKLDLGHFITNANDPIDQMLVFDPVEGLAINITINSLLDYVPGYYINSNNEKIEGYIKKSAGYYINSTNEKIPGYFKKSSDSKAFSFTKEKDTNSVLIKANEALGFKVGLDSFVVMQDVWAVNSIYDFPIIKKPSYVLVESIDEYFKLYKCDLNGLGYFFEFQDSLYNTPNSSSAFNKLISRILGSSHPMLEYIKANNIKGEDIVQFVNAYHTYQTFQNKDTLYFQQNYNSCRKSQASYYALVDSFDTSNFQITHYDMNDLKLLTGSYTSLKPLKKNGEFVWYHTNGTVRKKAIFEHDEIIKFTTYFRNGQMHYEYNVSSYLGELYTKVYQQNGEAVDMNKPKQIEMFRDSSRSRRIKREYKRGELIESVAYEDAGKSYMQMTRKNAKFVKSGNKLWDYFESILYYDDRMLLEQEEGIAYVRLLIDSKGKLETIEVLRGISETTDKKIIEAFSKTDEKFQIWKPASNFNGFDVPQEIVVPINFSIMSEHPKTYFYNNFMHQHFMHQQMMTPMNTDNLPIPSGFR